LVPKEDGPVTPGEHRRLSVTYREVFLPVTELEVKNANPSDDQSSSSPLHNTDRPEW
jgi:hypothetical protein